jgi:hypothetical protein
MTNHLVMAVIGFAAFVFFALIALLAQNLHATGRDNSYLEGRMLIARKLGSGWFEQLAQSPTALLVQKWITFALAAAALIFTVWHATMAVVSE